LGPWRGVAVNEPYDLIRPGRTITGMSAVLLPHITPDTPDVDGFVEHLERTVEAGLIPAVNMDTGFGPDLSPAERARLLGLARDAVDGELVAGIHVDDRPGDPMDLDTLLHAVDSVVSRGATPILFPCHGLAGLDDAGVVEIWSEVSRRCDRFLGFELSQEFHPAGRILGLDAYEAVLSIPSCVGAKHSSLDRQPEWERLRLRDRIRPEFLVLTGNDLAVDMVCYGSDYLLGITTFAPDLFAERDRLWAVGDPAFHQLNDDLQYLGRFAFRRPVPGYKHSAAQFLRLRGWIDSDVTRSGSPERPTSDVAVLTEIADRLGVLAA